MMSIKRRRNVRRKALIVGIDKYQNPNNNLNGCVNDAKDAAETLKILGFPRTKIKMVLDEQATTQGILDGLGWLVKDAIDGDVLIFYYSGHGSNVTDLDNEEQDRLDEMICPHDIDWRTQKYITDDKLHDYFTAKLPKGVRTDVILDSCFSGSATRSLILDFAERGPQSTQRYLPPPPEYAYAINAMIPAFTEKRRFGYRSISGPEVQETQNNVLWAACQENQVSWELNLGGKIRGAFTYYIMRILRKSNGNITRGDAYSICKSSMANDGFEQVPNLELPSAEALDIFPFRKASEIDMLSELKTKVDEEEQQQEQEQQLPPPNHEDA